MLVNVKHNIILLQVDFIAQKVLGHVVFCSLLNVDHSDLIRMVKAMPLTVTSGYTSMSASGTVYYIQQLKVFKTSPTAPYLYSQIIQNI